MIKEELEVADLPMTLDLDAVAELGYKRGMSASPEDRAEHDEEFQNLHPEEHSEFINGWKEAQWDKKMTAEKKRAAGVGYGGNGPRLDDEGGAPFMKENKMKITKNTLKQLIKKELEKWI